MGRVRALGRPSLLLGGHPQAARVVGADDQITAQITQATFGTVSQDEWEEQMINTTGFQELNREEVGRLLRRRE